MLASIYQVVGSLGIKDAYGKAIESYQTASRLNPFNPGLKLAIASVYFAESKTKEAKDYATQALTLKPDYIDALITLAQIAKNEGNLAEALSFAQQALALDPTNKTLIQYVNSLNNPGTNNFTPTTSTTPSSTKTKKAI